LGSSITSIGKRYTKQGLWSLFLTCAFPLHAWTIILVLRDVGWVSERTNAWDAIGLGAYALLFAFVESLIIFFVFTLFGFLTPNHWTVDKRIAFLSLFVLILSAWGIISQLLFLWNVSLPASAIRFLAQSGHPVRIMYAASLAVVLPSVGVPVYFFLRSDRLFRSIQDLSERLSLLTVFYLFFDLAGLVIVLIRNIP
jgi:hypothetical protein